MIAGIKAPFLAICLLCVPVPLLQRKALHSGATRHLTHLQLGTLGMKTSQLASKDQGAHLTPIRRDILYDESLTPPSCASQSLRNARLVVESSLW